jgi:hypothetical protein
MSVADRRRQGQHSPNQPKPLLTDLDVESTPDALSLTSSTAAYHPKNPPVADSWDDDDDDAASDTEPEPTPHATASPSAPPPTPCSPTAGGGRGWGTFESPYATEAAGLSSPARALFRPEKSTAVAGRLIAGALGVKAPKKSEEARAYEKAVREKEVRRREKEREEGRRAEEEREKARKEVWDS